jgi:hypothetical protein
LTQLESTRYFCVFIQEYVENYIKKNKKVCPFTEISSKTNVTKELEGLGYE